MLGARVTTLRGSPVSVTFLSRASLKVMQRGVLTHPRIMTADRKEMINLESILAEEKS
jgi:hypothetical protein